MEKEFVPYEIASALKELGFDEPCFWWYDFEKELRKDRIGVESINSKYFIDSKSCSAPLYSQAFRWFRENCGLSHEIHLKMSNNERKIWYNINELDNRLIKSMSFKSYPKGMFKSYEEAELECLKKLIEIVKQK